MNPAQTYTNPSKKWLLLILSLLALYLVKTEWWDKPTLVTVIGEGKIKVKPDLAQLTIGVTNLSTASAQAVTGNNLKVKTLRDTLKTFGVEEKDTSVGSFKVTTINDQNVYQGVNSVSLTFKDLSKLDDLLKSLKSQNYQNIAIKYATKNPDQVKKQLLQAVIKDGKDKAGEIGRSINKFLVGRVVSLIPLTEDEGTTANLQSNSEVELSKTASMVVELH